MVTECVDTLPQLYVQYTTYSILMMYTVESSVLNSVFSHCSSKAWKPPCCQSIRKHQLYIIAISHSGISVSSLCTVDERKDLKRFFTETGCYLL